MIFLYCFYYTFFSIFLVGESRLVFLIIKGDLTKDETSKEFTPQGLWRKVH